MLVARDALEEWPTGREGRLFTNIVMMGMGEPLFNYDATVAALRLAMDEHGLNLSRRRITVSTSGVVPRIEQLGCGPRRRARDLAACGTRRAARRAGADQSQMEHRHAARRLPQLSFAAADHLRVCDAARRERQRRRRARAGAPAAGHSGQGQPDPVQPLAGLDLHLLLEQPHPRLRADRRGGRPRLAGAHAARPRHPRRLRPAAHREPAPARPACRARPERAAGHAPLPDRPARHHRRPRPARDPGGRGRRLAFPAAGAKPCRTASC